MERNIPFGLARGSAVDVHEKGLQQAAFREEGLAAAAGGRDRARLLKTEHQVRTLRWLLWSAWFRHRFPGENNLVHVIAFLVRGHPK
jgi:hypothetical protein